MYLRQDLYRCREKRRGWGGMQMYLLGHPERERGGEYDGVQMYLRQDLHRGRRLSLPPTSHTDNIMPLALPERTSTFSQLKPTVGWVCMYWPNFMWYSSVVFPEFSTPTSTSCTEVPPPIAYILSLLRTRCMQQLPFPESIVSHLSAFIPARE